MTKYVVTLSVETDRKFAKKVIRTAIERTMQFAGEAVAIASPDDGLDELHNSAGLMKVRVRTVDID